MTLRLCLTFVILSLTVAMPGRAGDGRIVTFGGVTAFMAKCPNVIKQADIAPHRALRRPKGMNPASL